MLSVSFVCHLSVVNVYVLNEDGVSVINVYVLNEDGVSVVTLRCILS